VVSTPQFVGRVVGNYRILEMLGSGGMGAVYRAEDARLGRQVALKLLLDESVLDADSIERFRREARAASALHHPYICTVFDAGDDNGVPFLAMELLEGQTLAQMIAAHPMKTTTTLALAIQICDGLEFAHEKGFIHRDLKPSNIFVTTRGDAKLLDFGLAKKIHAEAAGVIGSTVTSAVTQQGQLLGTAPYMSPEQAEGKVLDVRSDIFSLGAVLYEMATGVRAFPGESAATILAAVLRGEPRPARVMNPEVPGELQRIIAKAMEKEPEERYQSAKELIVDLRRLIKELSGPITARSAKAAIAVPRSWLGVRPLWYAVPAVAVAALATAIVLTPAPVSAPLEPKQLTFSAAPKTGPLLTDGSRLYFKSREAPFQVAVSGGIVVPMQSLQPGMVLWDVSADGSKILAWKPDPNDEVGRGTLWAGSMLGGGLRRVTNHTVQAAQLSPGGENIYFADLENLYLCDANGGNERKLWTASSYIADIGLSPDEKQLAVSLSSGIGESTKLWSIRGDGTHANRLLKDWQGNASLYSARWTPDSRHFIFSSDRDGRNNVYELVQPRWFEFWKKPKPVRITGNELALVDSVPSRDSKGLYTLEQMDQGESRVYDPRSGHMLPYLNGASLLQFVLSPDRQWMAYTEWPSSHLWKSRVDGSEPAQLTDTPANFIDWSPDGKTIVYSDWKRIYTVSPDGGAPEPIQPAPNDMVQLAPSWSGDSRHIYFNSYPLPGHPETFGIRVFDRGTRQVSTMPGAEKFFEGTWSPDRHYLIAYAQSPARMVLYTVATGKWSDLIKLQTPGGFLVWARNSKSVYMAMVAGQNGIYRLGVPDGKWEKIVDIEVNIASSSFLSLSPDGQPVIMSHSGAAQIYYMHWKQ
jgi:eukaryotic-like serine/threonine-protein kinase